MRTARPGARPAAARPGRLLVAVLLLACALLAAFPGEAAASSNRKGDWHTYRTSHFNIVFHPEVKAQADFARGFLEEAYKSMLKRLELRDRYVPITVVLTGRIDESNGYATPLGHKIVIWTRPGQVIASNEIAWLRRVLAHELAHQITFLALRNWMGVYSEVYKMANLPVWFMEGAAQYLSESWDAKRNTFFAHALHNSALEPYPAMASFIKPEPVSGRLVYEQGHAFVRYLAENHGGAPFLGKWMRKITVIPVWSEIKGLLTPLTEAILPLEGALWKLTGKTARTHWREFLATVEAGLPGRQAEFPDALVVGAGTLDLVFQARRLGPDDHVVTAQADWDVPRFELRRVRGGKAEKMGGGFVNPVFDLSPDGKRLAYVREFSDLDGEPVNKLFVKSLETGEEAFLSDGAYHPAFLGPDTVAFSRWDAGEQTLVLCPVTGGAGCREPPQDSLGGFFALSRSSRGLLMNASDKAGRTGIWEWSADGGFQRLLQDTVLSEFPVEADDASVWMIRESGGLMQVAALDRASGAVSPVRTFPAGTFYLHRAAPGVLASVAQVGHPRHWQLAPVDLGSGARAGSAGAPAPSAPVSAADDTATAYAMPAFLQGPAPLPGTLEPKLKPKAPGSYLSPLEMDLLLVLPYLVPFYPATTLGAGVLLQDPLELHTLQASLGITANRQAFLGYDFLYVNAQTPLSLALASTNTLFEVDRIDLPEGTGIPGYKYLDRVVQTAIGELSATALAPWDMPLPHALFLTAGVGGERRVDRLGGEIDTAKRIEFEPFYRLRKWAFHRLALGYSYSVPYAWSLVHPLRETAFGVAHMRRYPGSDDYLQAVGQHTFPLWRALTFTLFSQATWSFAEFQRNAYPVPGVGEYLFTDRRQRGWTHDSYAALDFPLLENYLFELPLFGVCNFIGAGAFGTAGGDDYQAGPYTSLPGLNRTRASAGGRIYALFHVLRKLPFVFSQSAEYDFAEKEIVYRLTTDIGRLPSPVTGALAPRHPRGKRGLVDWLHRPFSR